MSWRLEQLSQRTSLEILRDDFENNSESTEPRSSQGIRVHGRVTSPENNKKHRFSFETLHTAEAGGSLHPRPVISDGLCRRPAVKATKNGKSQKSYFFG